MVDIEEMRRKQLEENQKRLKELGLLEGAKTLAAVVDSKKKSQQRPSKPKAKNTSTVEPRRSSRPRNAVVSYSDDVDINLPTARKRSRPSSSSWMSYTVRPLDEVKFASSEERTRAIQAAESFQSCLKSENPSFVKSMVRSHVYNCFWLGLPSKFCEDHLSKKLENVVLEDESGAKYDAIYIGSRKGLSGGWRAFALAHKLNDGDALVFELIELTKFKIYIFRASCKENDSANREVQLNVMDVEEKSEAVSQEPEKKSKPKKAYKLKKEPGRKKQPKRACTMKKEETIKYEEKSKKNKLQETVKDEEKSAALMPRKKREPRLFFKRA